MTSQHPAKHPTQHPAPSSLPDPLNRIGVPIQVPHGQKPNPVYQELLTLYAKIYGAEETLVKALHPPRRTASNGEAWSGKAATQWATEVDSWSHRLNQAGETVMQELAAKLRATPPFVPIGTPEPARAVVGWVGPATVVDDPVPGTPRQPGQGGNPGGPQDPNPRPGGGMRPGNNPGGTRASDPHPVTRH